MTLTMSRTVGAKTFELSCDSGDFDLIRLAIKIGYAVPVEPTPAPAEETPAEETPAEETPAEETPVEEEAPAEEEASGASAEVKPKRGRKSTKK